MVKHRINQRFLTLFLSFSKTYQARLSLNHLELRSAVPLYDQKCRKLKLHAKTLPFSLFALLKASFYCCKSLCCNINFRQSTKENEGLCIFEKNLSENSLCFVSRSVVINFTENYLIGC